MLEHIDRLKTDSENITRIELPRSAYNDFIDGEDVRTVAVVTIDALDAGYGYPDAAVIGDLWQAIMHVDDWFNLFPYVAGDIRPSITDLCDTLWKGMKLAGVILDTEKMPQITSIADPLAFADLKVENFLKTCRKLILDLVYEVYDA